PTRAPASSARVEGHDAWYGSRSPDSEVERLKLNRKHVLDSGAGRRNPSVGSLDVRVVPGQPVADTDRGARLVRGTGSDRVAVRNLHKGSQLGRGDEISQLEKQVVLGGQH